MRTSTFSNSRGKPWLQYVLPSVSDLIFVVLLLSLTIGVLGPRLLGDADTGWHIRNGELILSTHSVPRTDPFSSTMQGKTWYSWEWLYDAGLGLAHRWAGLNGVVFTSALLIAATFAWMFRLALARGGNVAGTVVLSLLAMGAASIHFLARPHLVSWLLTLLWFHLLDSSERSSQGGRRLFWLPVIMLLWVNVHGGFLMGFILLGIYVLPNAIYFFRTRTVVQRKMAAKRCKRLGLVTLLCALATLVNPYGYQLHVHVYQYLSNRFLMDHINEFQSPNFHGLPQQCFLLLCLITVAALSAWRISVSLADLLIVLFAIASGLYASRNLPASAILLTLVIAPLLSNRSAERADAEPEPEKQRFSYLHSLAIRMEMLEKRMRWHLWPAVVVVLMFWACSAGGNLGGRQIMASAFSERRFPVKAADFLQQRQVAGPIFAPDDWGGYLIYRLYPFTRVVADDRHDLYGETFFKNYLKLVQLKGGWEEVLDNLPMDWALLPADAPLAGALEKRSDWEVVYRDQVAVLLKHK